MKTLWRLCPVSVLWMLVFGPSLAFGAPVSWTGGGDGEDWFQARSQSAPPQSMNSGRNAPTKMPADVHVRFQRYPARNA